MYVVRKVVKLENWIIYVKPSTEPAVPSTTFSRALSGTDSDSYRWGLRGINGSKIG
jgi:hypothetical protein